MMLLSDSVGGADDSRNGLSNRRPVNVTESPRSWRTLYGSQGLRVRVEGLRVAGSQGRRVEGSQGRIAFAGSQGPCGLFDLSELRGAT